jgi:hypothetical protein
MRSGLSQFDVQFLSKVAAPGVSQQENILKLLQNVSDSVWQGSDNILK